MASFKDLSWVVFSDSGSRALARTSSMVVTNRTSILVLRSPGSSNVSFVLLGHDHLLTSCVDGSLHLGQDAPDTSTLPMMVISPVMAICFVPDGP